MDKIKNMIMKKLHRFMLLACAMVLVVCSVVLGYTDASFIVKGGKL